MSDSAKKERHPLSSPSSGDIRLERSSSATLQSWRRDHREHLKKCKKNASISCGWGKLIFGQTFSTPERLITEIDSEEVGTRNIALYVPDPHVLISLAPERLFLDPSHTFRLWFHDYRGNGTSSDLLFVRRANTKRDIRELNTLYLKRGMVPLDDKYILGKKASRLLVPIVVESVSSGEILGGAIGVDHALAFNDPENGSSLWSLVVNPQSQISGAGEALTRFLIDMFVARGRQYLDLSVMHSNTQAISLYEKIGFKRIPVFCVKRKNEINEPLFIPPSDEDLLNPYATILVNEAKRRGIRVDVIDEEKNLFKLQHGGRSILCRESLSEMTNAISLTICDDKKLTHKLLENEGLQTPVQRSAGSPSENEAFLRLYKRVVVKPLSGEQGAGVTIDIQDEKALQEAITRAKKVCDEVLIEQFVEGIDLRVVIINYRMVAAAIRKPAMVIGDGIHPIRYLIKKQSRRRSAATGGESTIPLDRETERVIELAGYSMESVLEANKELEVRKTANLHTGGTIHDVTNEIHDELRHAAEQAARAIGIPVAGIDMLVPSVTEPTYTIIEVNERPGLENHQPQPTAEKFIDMIFPETSRSLLPYHPNLGIQDHPPG